MSMNFYPPSDYQKKCQSLFDVYRQQVLSQLPNAKVEHIGASSITGAISKGDLDIFVGVPAAGFESSVTRLQTLEFKEKPDTLRTESLCMLEHLNQDIALQVVALGSEFECFLAFRNALNQSPKLVAQYNALKMSCEGLTHEAYREKKSAFIEQVLSLV